MYIQYMYIHMYIHIIPYCTILYCIVLYSNIILYYFILYYGQVDLTVAEEAENGWGEEFNWKKASL